MSPVAVVVLVVLVAAATVEHLAFPVSLVAEVTAARGGTVAERAVEQVEQVEAAASD